jgi:shikimate kinase
LRQEDKETRRVGDTERKAEDGEKSLPSRSVADRDDLSPCLLVSLSPCLFLVGYRGTGKTTVGRLVAEGLGWTSVDADEVLERRYGRTVRQIFAEEGEAGFRDKEAVVLGEICRLRQHVVATGGGVVLSEDNRRRLREAGRVVWLTADARTLWERLQQDAATAERRPTLTVGGLTEIEELLRVREPLYRSCAHVVVNTVGRSAEEVAAAILKAYPQKGSGA